MSKNVNLLSVTPLKDGIMGESVIVSSEGNREQRSEENNHTRRKDSVESRESIVINLTPVQNRNDAIIYPEQESQCNTENVESEAEDRTEPLSPGDTMMSGSAPESSPMVTSPDRRIENEGLSEIEHLAPDDQGNMGVCSGYALAKAVRNGFKTKKFVKGQDLDFNQGETASALINLHRVTDTFVRVEGYTFCASFDFTRA